MKVLVIVDSLRLGGAENVLVTLAKAAPRAGFAIEVACLAPAVGATASMVPVLKEAGVTTRFLDVPRLLHRRSVPAVRHAIRDTGCDVVHAHLEYAATIASLAAVGTGRPVFSSFHQLAAPLPPKEALKERIAVWAADRGRGVVFVSEASLQSYARRYTRRSNWTVIPNGVDLSVFRPGDQADLRELGIPPGAPVVTLVAALRPGKGHAAAIAAWPEVLACVPEARLVLVGDGAEERKLRDQVAELGLAGQVVFAGLRTDVADLLRASTLALLPSESEALPTALLEAAACGRAAVATTVGGIPEVVVDGETGLLVPVGSVEALAAAVIRLLQDNVARTQMGAAARCRAEQLFSAETWVARLRTLYDSTGASAAGPVPDDP